MIKILKIVFLLFIITGFTTLTVIEALPQNQRKIAAIQSELKSASRLALMQGSIRRVDKVNPEVNLIAILDSWSYSNYVGHMVKVSSGWTYIVVTGEKAIFLSNSTHAYGFTDYINHVVVIFEHPLASTWRIFAHEFTHVLQAEDGMRITKLKKVQLEYEAEITARTVGDLLDTFIKSQVLPTRPLSASEELDALVYLSKI